MSWGLTNLGWDEGFGEAMREAREKAGAGRWGRQGKGSQGAEAGTGAGATPSGSSALLSSAPISNGFYTLTFPDGSHRTFRVHTQRGTAKFAPGRRVISLLIGPDNTEDYEMVAFLERDGPAPWKRHRGTKIEVHLGILWELATGRDVAGCELLVSRRCLVCNHTLTDDESIRRGIGPTCWERMHG